MTASPEQETEAPARFERDEPVTILVTATADAEYETCAPGGTLIPVLEAKLPSVNRTRVTVPCDGYPGVRVIHGDISPTLIQMAQDAIVSHRPKIACAACEPGRPCPGCVISAQRRREYGEVLKALGGPPET